MYTITQNKGGGGHWSDPNIAVTPIRSIMIRKENRTITEGPRHLQFIKAQNYSKEKAMCRGAGEKLIKSLYNKWQYTQKYSLEKKTDLL